MVDHVERSGTAVGHHARAHALTGRLRQLELALHDGGLADVLQRDHRPLLGQLHHGGRVHQAVAKFVVVLAAAAVAEPACLAEERRGPAGHHDQVLQVAPGEARVGLERQGADPGGDGGGGGGAGVLVRADLVGSEAGVLVHSDDALVLKNRE